MGEIPNFRTLATQIAIAGVGITAAFPVVAQEQDDGNRSSSLEEDVVIGSGIKNSELDSASPVTIIGVEAIYDSGISNVEDILQEMTASAGITRVEKRLFRLLICRSPGFRWS